MTYFPDGMPSPQFGPDDKPFWDFCNKRELRIQACASCGKFRHPPVPACGHCGSLATEWVQVTGRGTVYTYTVAHHAVHAVLKGHPPYNVVVVLLDGADDVRIVSNVVDVSPDDICIGMPVELIWETQTDGSVLPRFRKENA